ncbi:hypothetical protein TUMEXPCC7403_06540 [Tumidithrix helvetica PCC 7403]|uniref:hormogonium polysaccharide secretion pseudopilin HpsB n=1 Tax=Tumidithrix helvetica TaxID=3457545 RepID=UPI003CBB6DF9
MKTTFHLSKYNQPALVCLGKKVLSSQTQKTSSQAGFSLVESLVAVVVVSVLLTGIAPFLALTFGQRVQARRIDQATQAARAYIDGLRSGTIQVPNDPALNQTDARFDDPVTYPNLNVDVLTALPNTALTPGTLVSTDGTPFSTSNPQHLVIQAMRSRCLPVATCNNSDVAAIRLQGYRVSIRVYRADAFVAPIALLPPVNTANGSSYTQSAFSGTLGSKSRPLLVMQSDITANSTGTTTGTTFRNYQDRLGN